MKYSVKMRASQLRENQQIHICGAERIVEREVLDQTVSALYRRALNHPRGVPDFIQVKTRAVAEEDITYLPILPYHAVDVSDYCTGLEKMREIFAQFNEAQSQKFVDYMHSENELRGAMLIDVYTGERLEPNLERGIRLSNMDYVTFDPSSLEQKNHRREAMVLATKALSAPGILAEASISDDPDYISGYIATKEGYFRISHLKEWGSPYGLRIMLFDSKAADLDECIDYLQNRNVLVYE